MRELLRTNAMPPLIRSVILALRVLPVMTVVACGFVQVFSNTETSHAESPDHRLRAIAFDRRCTGTVPCSPVTWISILSASEDLPKGEGNAVSIGDGGHALGSPAGNVEVRLEWKTNDLLIVWYPGPAKVLFKQDMVRSVRIECRWVGLL